MMDMVQAQLAPIPAPEPQTSFTLDDATRRLYERAVDNPSSLNDAERRKILRRPSPEDEDVFCCVACELTISELFTKAIRHGESLSYQEAYIVVHGVGPSDSEKRFSERARMNPADRGLLSNAIEAARTSDERTARKNAWAVHSRWIAAESAAYKVLTDDDLQNLKRAVHVPWQEHVVSLGEPSRQKATYGLVLFVLKSTEWPLYNEQIGIATEHTFNLRHRKVKDAIKAGFTLHQVEYDDRESLQTRFAAMRDANEFPDGLRHDAFLYVDEEALHSRKSTRPFVWLWKPQDSAEPLKVDIKHIALTLVARLTQQDLSTDKARWPYRHTSELEELHKASKYSRSPNGELDGIWPPPGVCM